MKKLYIIPELKTTNMQVRYQMICSSLPVSSTEHNFDEALSREVDFDIDGEY